MLFKGTPNINGFVDFCNYHANGQPIYFVNGRLYAGFDMLAMIECRYNFTSTETRRNVEKKIAENMSMFNVEETSEFFYPNERYMHRYDKAWLDAHGIANSLVS